MEKVKNIVKWLKKIEEEDYPWSLEGYHDWKLGAASIFAKLATIYQNHETFDKEGIKNHIMKYKHNDEYFVCVPGDKNIIAETRQAMSGLYNLGYDVGNCNVSKFFQEPLFFMNDRSWSNPWDAGAQVSHYLFFHHHTGQKEKNEEMLNKIENPTEYISAISKLLPYAVGKKKAYEEMEEIEPITINFNLGDKEEN